MTAKVKLSAILDALESAGDEHSYYLDRETGEVHLLTDEVMDLAEDETPTDDLQDHMREAVQLARQVQEDDSQRYLELPGKFDIHEIDIMDFFISTVKDDRVQRELRNGIRGAGAFRTFKHLVDQHNVRDAWHKFREARLREIAVEWCEENNIPWREK